MKGISKKGKEKRGVGTWVVVFSVVFLAFISGFYLWPEFGLSNSSRLSGVVLENGEIYFGKLSYFPRLALTSAYTVQVLENPDDPSQIKYRVLPIEASLWGPKKIFLNYDKIVFIGEVSEESELMKIIRQEAN